MSVNKMVNKQSGFTLLEVLVAMIVLSIGLLGLSGLQTTSVRSNHSAFLRSQATTLSMDIMDRMRANRDGAIAGSYNIAYATTATSPGCNLNCSNGQVAQRDLFQWRSFVERLPGGESEVDVTATGVAEVKIRWFDARDGNKLEVKMRSSV
ncbi:type IV pilus modification protein PilV [Thiosocius teredinicola]|uniref:type IV pilus modification protein PilV n=1 Tax=Thiosocius teredinicola TaxID=1973002 RepID=UPI000991182E